ncbi:MAG: hypothetical protein PGN07_12620 [Aeromicrobium erythreum]
MKWVVRVVAGVVLALLVLGWSRGDFVPGTGKALGICMFGVLAFAGWFEASDRDEFLDDTFRTFFGKDKDDDDHSGGPPATA